MKLIFVFSLSLFISFFSLAQNLQKKEKKDIVDEYVVDNDNDTIYGKVNVSSFSISVKLSSGEKLKFKAEEIKSFKEKSGSVARIGVSTYIYEEKEKTLLYLDIKGKINYYSGLPETYGASPSMGPGGNMTGGGSGTRYRYYVQKGNGEVFEVRPKYDKQIKEMFADCPHAEKEMRPYKTKKKVEIYNEKCN